jgi:hypothetical protein
MLPLFALCPILGMQNNKIKKFGVFKKSLTFFKESVG